MKYLPFIIVALALVFMLGKCSGEHTRLILPDINMKDIISKERKLMKQEADIEILKGISEHTADAVKEYRDRWHTVIHDSLIPCEEKIIICDTLITKDSTLIAQQAKIIAGQDTVIKGYKEVVKDLHKAHTVDSVTIISQKKEIRKQKWQKWGILALWGAREVAGAAVR